MGCGSHTKWKPNSSGPSVATKSMYTKYPVRPSNHDRGLMMQVWYGSWEKAGPKLEVRRCPGGGASVYAAMGTWDATVTTWAGRRAGLEQVGAQASGKIIFFTLS